MRKALFIFIACTILFACQSNKNNKLVSNTPLPTTDEVFAYNMDDFGTIKRVKNAHSGNYVSLMDTSSLYSFTFKRKIGDIKDDSIRRIKVEVSAWVYTIKPVIKSNLVFSVDSNGKTISWNGINLTTMVREPRTWTFVKAMFSMPKNATPENVLSAYFWNTDKCDTLMIDDFEVKFTR